MAYTDSDKPAKQPKIKFKGMGIDNPKGYTDPPRKPIFVPDEPTPRAKELMRKGKRVAFT